MMDVWQMSLRNGYIKPKNQDLHQLIEETLEHLLLLDLQFIVQEYLCSEVKLGSLSVGDRPGLIQYVRTLEGVGRVTLEIWHMNIFSRRLFDTKSQTDADFVKWFYPLYPAEIFVSVHF